MCPERPTKVTSLEDLRRALVGSEAGPRGLAGSEALTLVTNRWQKLLPVPDLQSC
jgi:hypothetical protein